MIKILKKQLLLFFLMMPVLATKTFAYDFSAENSDGVTLYYNYINNGNELEVTLKDNKAPHYSDYTGTIAIPIEVTYMGRTRKVTSIGENAFNRCKGLTSVIIPEDVTKIGQMAFYQCEELTSITIPEKVTYIGSWAFSGCNGLISITIPKNVTGIGSWAFDCNNLSTVISMIENPFKIYGATSYDHTFNKNTFYNAILYVPSGTLEKYKTTEGWKDFYFIEEVTGGETPETQTCAKPTISYSGGKLTFTSATEGAICYSSITDTDIKSYESNEVQLTVTYNISVYATKSGYENSETATATLCWIEQEPKTEGLDAGIAQVPAKAVLIQTEARAVRVLGADEGTLVSVYGVNGSQAGSAISTNGSAVVNTNLQSGNVAIVKIGHKSVKVVLR